MNAVPPTVRDTFLFLDEDRKFLRTLAELARLDPRLRVRENESDIVQDTLKKAVQKYGADLANMKTGQRRALLRGILNNRVVDLIRHYHAERRDVDRDQTAKARVEESSIAWEKNIAAKDLSPEETLAREERFARVAIAVQSLPDKQKLVIHTKFFLDLSLSEVADLIGLKQSQVAGLYTRGMKMLRKLLTDLESQA